MGEKDAKVTTMVLKVDLDCQKCYKKVKKVLCKFPQIRDQVFDDKKNTVTIRVVCCSPEKIRDKLCCKGSGSIKSIEIKEPEKSKATEKPKESADKPPQEKPKQVTFAGVPKDSDKKMQEKPKEGGEKKKEGAEKEKPKDGGEKKKEGAEKEKPKDAEKPKQIAAAPEAVKVVAAQAVQGYPSMYPVSQYYDGFSAGPSYPPAYGGGGHQPHLIQYDGYYGRPVYDSWAGTSAGGYNNYNYNNNNHNRNCYEENPACTIM